MIELDQLLGPFFKHWGAGSDFYDMGFVDDGLSHLVAAHIRGENNRILEIIDELLQDYVPESQHSEL